ncbi:hypothetical protein ASPVEDRAFT_83991 [Aspergillus versicolor CBS 583.65]|uniref:Uncharacterized protein n=1 Tax=Aspergillus versicolor CBS 583.65 TaxID=1036611 RepID=A0A1L9PM34_ASPVE|nr:uncharacterized protein ASPVEDRAFT_83991 [Aspergillus versicolor CBS 583.65]OJJ02496.1 hypothetical protein ASPVEDRAFT_83991 [Aspergillus versicolor CBS 583.65]
MSDSDCSSGSNSCTFTCPAGGTWYVCPSAPYFVGCCSSDPCSNTNSNNTSPCPDVYPATFDTAIFDRFVPNNCIDVSSDNWFTCNFTDPPFVGCCASNPCATTDGCPKDDVRAAAWSSSRTDQFTLFQDVDRDRKDEEDGGLGGGAIAGIVVGCVAAVVIGLALIWWFLRRKKKSKIDSAPGGHGRTTSVVEGERQAMYNGEYTGYQHPQSPYQGMHSNTCTNGRVLIVDVDSHFSSPGGTTIGPKYLSGSSTGISSLPSSPPMASESGHAVSEIYSSNGDEQPPYNRGSAQYGLGVFAKPQTIPELDSTSRPPEVHELEGGNRQ